MSILISDSPNVAGIKSCAEANRPVDETHYEVALDNHGARNGPKIGRQLAIDNASANLYSKRKKDFTKRIFLHNQFVFPEKVLASDK